MKFNWGTGIILAFIAFISFIMYFVIHMNMNDKYDTSLVTENYYKAELEFQDEINKENNAKALTTNISWIRTDKGLEISFPKSLDTNKITGKVFLYRPSNKQVDFETTISLSNHNLLIPDNRLLDGRWNIKVDWQYKGKSYLYKKEIIY
ncbi:FixH family protein [Psychroserpens burtonensis]|uniref:FixH family protein n=1 Tax=Psychroserpens burtonensis TaxID=49278 RepID=A0A5C7B801_9FLAO|nr:FixH family protein [Psychroserpens burtonensis]TXE17042.1 FixH family protein [Psychroserpens burtonensis]